MSSKVSDRLFSVAARSECGDDARACLPLSECDDLELMRRVVLGEEAALGELLERYALMVRGIGYRILRDTGEAQELVQDVFLHVFRKAQIFDPERGAFRTWLIRVACSRALNRRQYLNLRRFYDNRNLDDYVEVFEAATNIEYQVQLGQCGRVLEQAFSDLSEKQRETLELYFFEGYTLREVSERMSESLANTRHYYYRALQKLRTSVHVELLKGK